MNFLDFKDRYKCDCRNAENGICYDCQNTGYRFDKEISAFILKQQETIDSLEKQLKEEESTHNSIVDKMLTLSEEKDERNT